MLTSRAACSWSVTHHLYLSMNCAHTCHDMRQKPHLIKCSKVWGQATMHTQHLPIYESLHHTGSLCYAEHLWLHNWALGMTSVRLVHHMLYLCASDVPPAWDILRPLLQGQTSVMHCCYSPIMVFACSGYRTARFANYDDTPLSDIVYMIMHQTWRLHTKARRV